MPRTGRGAVVGYVLRKFPVLSETFVLNEILALERQGLKVQIFSLDLPRDPRFHENLPQLKAPIWYVPGLADLRVLARFNRQASARFGRSYRRALLYALASGRPMLLWRFLQAGYVAERAARFGVTHLHAHFATRATSVALLVSMITGTPYSFTAHAYDIHKSHVDKRVLKEKVKRARFVVTICDFNMRFLNRLCADAASKLVLVRNGIELERFSPGIEVGRHSPFRVLAVARLIEKKGIPVLIEACRILQERGAAFTCSIVGRGRLRPQLQEMVDRRGLAQRVKLLGGRSQGEVIALYRACDLFVLPSLVTEDGDREGLPVAIVEALACGLPVVSTPVSGIPEVVRHEHNGLLVAPNDPAALADAIERLMTDRLLYERLKRNTRSSVAGSFDLAATSAALCRHFTRAA